MTTEPQNPSSAPPREAARSLGFCTTRWTRVCDAKVNSEDGRAALAELCGSYYEPVVAYLRCELRDADAARELSHAFFAEVLAGNAMHLADRERGPFRFYLLGAVKHFLSHQRASAGRAKRGGGVAPVSLDDESVGGVADQRQVSPDAAFDRQWALTVLDRALAALREECVAEQREELFDKLKPWLTGGAAHGDQAALAAVCGMTPTALRMALHRLKDRFRQCVKAEVAGTLEDPSQVAMEMQSLFAALGG